MFLRRAANLVLSLTVLEETLAIFEFNTRRALTDLRWIVDLAGQGKPKKATLVKDAGDLFTDAIRSYAGGAAPPEPDLLGPLGSCDRCCAHVPGRWG